MKTTRFTAAIAALSLVLTATAAAPANAQGAPERTSFFELTPVARDVGPSIATAPRSDNARTPQSVVPLLKPGAGGGASTGAATDGALQTSATTPLGDTLLVNVDGVGVGITPTYKDCCTPPDTNLAVGTTQVVQWVNLDFAAFDKATGALLAGYPKAGNSIWAGFGGKCETNNSGDPIVKFDAQAQRWLMTQFAVSSQPYLQCFAVSNTADITTTNWNRYAFSFGNNFPDYPKAGVWANGPTGGAYFLSFNLFKAGVIFNGGAACAFDRSKMLVGLAATGQCFNLGTAAPSLLPGDLDGANGAAGATAAPPDVTTDVFANFGTNTLNLWKMHVDFASSANTTITKLPSLTTTAFSKACGGGTCIPQAGTGQQLDSLADRLMYRLAYRNFGTHESLVVTHSVTGSGTAAPRWYELQTSTVGSFAYSIYQQSSYAPDATYRWMGSAAQNKLGDLAIGYSASSLAISPQIRYTGRAAGDPLGQLRQEATVALPSTGSNTGPYSRWGDYSSIVTDPADDCTFWYTTEYLKQNGGSFTWSTRIVSFKLGC